MTVVTETRRITGDMQMCAQVVHGGVAEYIIDEEGVEAATVDAAIARWARVQPRPHVGVLVLALYQDDASAFAALRAALNGLPNEACLRCCGQVQPTTQVCSDLTTREREILSLIAQGRRNDEIASQLCLSIKTVRNHASNIFGKLQVVNRTQAAIRARELGVASSGWSRRSD